MPPIEEPHVFRTVSGGAFIVGDKWVNAEGKPIPDPFPPKPLRPMRSSVIPSRNGGTTPPAQPNEQSTDLLSDIDNPIPPVSE